MNRQHTATSWVRRSLLLLAVCGLVGCSLLPWARKRPDPVESVSGPAPYVENCELCHVPQAEAYAHSLHSAKGVRCGQCHMPGGHPAYTQPIRDGKCGGCHQPQYQQTLASRHYAGRKLENLDSNREQRKELRQHGFIVGSGADARFAGDEVSGDLGGRLCVACHYDGHRLGRGAVRAADACTGCHVKQREHYPINIPGLENRCIQCHVRVGTTVQGQVVNTHLFRSPLRREDTP